MSETDERSARERQKRAELRRLAGELGSERGRSAFLRARRLIRSLDGMDVSSIFIEVLNRSQDAREFDRAASLLSETGADTAAEALMRYARTQRRFPGLAIRALSQMKRPELTPFLLDLVEFGRFNQKTASIHALGRLADARAVEPLCVLAAAGSGELSREARTTLRGLGKPAGLAMRVLRADDLDAPERVRALNAIGEAFRFHPERFLERLSRREPSPVIEETLSLLRANGTLLRPSFGRDDGALLRALACAPESGELLRASSAAQTPSTRRASLFAYVADLFLRLVRLR